MLQQLSPSHRRQCDNGLLMQNQLGDGFVSKWVNLATNRESDIISDN
jgi:hypothetical protein